MSMYLLKRAVSVHKNKPTSMMVIVLLSALCFSTAAFGRDFAVTTPRVYWHCFDSGWNVVPHPIWKPDSSLVMFDTQGNAEFTDVQKMLLSAWGAEFVDVDSISSWLVKNRWVKVVREVKDKR